MKLHYYKLLLFSLPLNILVSSYENNKNKPYITPRNTPTTTSRVLIECNIYIPNYDIDPDMKSVKENFDRQISHRFEEYKERMMKNREKCKEQCDKDIQKIILKDKMEKSLEEKIEKGCLKCGCGLGGVAAGVGLLGTVVVNELKRAAMAATIEAAWAGGAAKGAVKGATAGFVKFIELVESTFNIQNIAGGTLNSVYSVTNYTDVARVAGSIYFQYGRSQCLTIGSLTGPENPFCSTVIKLQLIPGHVPGNSNSITDIIKSHVSKIVGDAQKFAKVATEKATENATAEAIKTNTTAVNAIYASYQTAIIASVVAILVIVLVMVIIYLILRYRRKKKINKKLQYTKLLNQ
ncbi:rifin [Plasmodium sp. gorilla clade G1]|nr:rifin [Plasmodium sp. gorilla clade G1]